MRILVLASLCFVTVAHAIADGGALTPNPPIELAGTHGKFDFIKVDAANRRLLACHTGNGSLDVIDLDSSKLIKSVPTGNAQGVVVDDKHGRYFVSDSKPPQLAIVDATKLEVTGTVSLPEPADLVEYHAQLNRVLVDDDEKPNTWIIDPESKKIMQTNTYPGSGLEDFTLDKWKSSILQNLKDTSELAKSDFVENKIPAKWSTLPAEKPHGLALVNDGDDLAVVGGNGKLVLMSMKEDDEGKVVASADVAQKVDEIAYDPGLNRIYCASGTGTISIVEVQSDKPSGWKLVSLGSVPSAQGAHSIAVDPKTHAVWIVFAKDDKPYAQSFAAKTP